MYIQIYTFSINIYKDICRPIYIYIISISPNLPHKAPYMSILSTVFFRPFLQVTTLHSSSVPPGPASIRRCLSRRLSSVSFTKRSSGTAKSSSAFK